MNASMGLVDYSSDSDSSADPPHDECPPAKKRRTSATSPSFSASSTPSHHQALKAKPPPAITSTTLPPLPASFHDLYAATVRPFTTDAPSLHQGRRRAIPHVAGNWPSHIYTEWRPTAPEHQVLSSLLSSLTAELTPLLLLPPDTTTQPPPPPALSPVDASRQSPAWLTSLLTSDLDAPLPLHVSLSRPFVLRTAERDGFLGDLARGVAASGVRAFGLRADGLGWFRGTDSARSFLVLRVRSSPTAAGGDGGEARWPGRGRNPELAALLARSNACVGGVGQPVLYAGGGRAVGPSAHGGEGAKGEKEKDVVAGDDGAAADEAFHVSIAWSFADPTEAIRERTAAVFAREEFQRGIVRGIRISVDGVKVKIGNVVTNIALAERGRKRGIGGGKGLFGI